MNTEKKLLNKNAQAIIKLSGTLGRYRRGDRLPRVSDLAREIGLSVGTTEYGLNYLREKDVITVTSKGHLGSFIEKIDYEKLPDLSGNNVMACVMPLPYSLRYEGLATAFCELGNQTGKFFLAFMNGSSRRIKALTGKRYDCALVSRMAADEAISQGCQIEVAVDYGPRSYLETHVLVHRTKTPGRIRTIGLDSESLDQKLLSRSFLAMHPGVKVVNLPYTNIIRRLLEGDVDATIWNLDYIREHQPLLQFTNLQLPQTELAMTQAALIIRLGDAAAQNYFTARFPKSKILKTQEAVFNLRRLPEY
ncbi:MAG: hypothetical protein FWD78_01370 [Treponema sp.]|nr:hypothetical protein [Treponema sp.]